ncbi:MAG: V-type ATPase subunit [Candidatus Omnitrophota bacterium]
MDNRLFIAKQTSGKDTRYTYATGRIRVLEARMLAKAVFEKMTEADSYEGALSILCEHPDYRQDAENLKDKSAFENLIVLQLKRLYDIMNELTRDSEITDILMFKHDVDNTKVLLKKEAGYDADEVLINVGVFTIDRLKEGITKKNFTIFKEEAFSSFFKAACSVENAVRIDDTLEMLYLGLLQKAFAKTESPFLLYLYGTMVDLCNIKILLRYNRHKRGAKEIIPEGGHLAGGFFYPLFDKPDAAVLKDFFTTPYVALLHGIFESKNADAPFDKYLLSVIKEAKSFHFGIEPLVGYVYAREYELKNVRRILAGKIYALEGGDIRNSLQEAYV